MCIDPLNSSSCYKGERSNECDHGRQHQALDGKLCRKHGMSEGTFYAWKAKYSGMTVSEAKRLTALEDENSKLKKLLAEQMLGNRPV